MRGHSLQSTVSGTRERLSLLACIGDCNDMSAYSGTPYHFLQTARTHGVLQDGLRLSVASGTWKIRRGSWNLRRALCGCGIGGYQYSAGFLEALWGREQRRLSGSVIVNCFQLYPPSVVHDRSIEKWFFIDQTLTQLFQNYGGHVSSVAQRAAIEQERAGYHTARGVIVNSRYAARSVIEEYGVPAPLVHVVLQGANIDESAYRKWDLAEGNCERHRAPERPLRLVFVGRDWRRKGLDRLIRALAAMQKMGSKVSLRVIGCEPQDVPSELRAVPRIEWLGKIDKHRETPRFIRAITECDLGCLLSRAEAGGISIREFHALGLPVLGPNAGGAPEQLIAQASIAVHPGMPSSDVAELLFDLERNPGRLETLRQQAWKSRHLALWSASIRSMLPIWPHAVIPRFRQLNSYVTQALD